ncbi:type VI secretion system tube protein Hcp [Roseateles sp. GG27B]
MAETMIFLKLTVDGKSVEGGAEAAEYAGLIDVESFSWGAVATHKQTSSKDITVDLRPKTLTLNKFYDQASTKLCSYAKDQKKFTTAKLIVINMEMSSGTRQPRKVLEIELQNGHIEGIKISASESGKSISMKEDLELSFDRFRLDYYPVQALKGGLQRSAAITCEFNMHSTDT